MDPRTQLDESTTERLRSVGTITVAVWRVTRTHPSMFIINKFRSNIELGIPEEVASSNDMPRRNKGHRKRKAVAIDGSDDESALAIFNFKYRSRGESSVFCV